MSVYDPSWLPFQKAGVNGLFGMFQPVQIRKTLRGKLNFLCPRQILRKDVKGIDGMDGRHAQAARSPRDGRFVPSIMNFSTNRPADRPQGKTNWTPAGANLVGEW